MTRPLPDLLETFAELAAALPDAVGEEVVVLSATTLPAPPAALATDRLCATWSWHFYGDAPVEMVSLEADKATLRALGLLVMASVFHPSPEAVTVRLTHPRSTIDTLRVAPERVSDDMPGYVGRPERFNYYAGAVEKHPWEGSWAAPDALPVAQLTNAAGFVVSTEDLLARHVLVGFGGCEASARFAALLLNVGRPGSAVDELELEGELGFRGVGPGSAELKIWLPGSFGYLDAPPRTEGRSWRRSDGD